MPKIQLIPAVHFHGSCDYGDWGGLQKDPRVIEIEISETDFTKLRQAHDQLEPFKKRRAGIGDDLIADVFIVKS